MIAFVNKSSTDCADNKSKVLVIIGKKNILFQCTPIVTYVKIIKLQYQIHLQ